MTVGNKGIYAAIFLLVFLLILIIGVTSEVSLSASVSRALLSGLAFTAFFWAAGKLISIYVFPETKEATDFTESDISADTSEMFLEANLGSNLGNNLDFTVSEPVSGIVEEIPKQFTPLPAKQIDPQVNKIINSDPQKVAEIVRKMGFEDE